MAPLKTVASAFAPLLLLACTQTAAVLPDGRVLVVGGGTAAVFDPSLGTFVPTDSPAVDHRMGSTATLLGDGDVLIAGGSSDQVVEGRTAPRTHRDRRALRVAGRTVPAHRRP
jgi:hypothetical protein